MIDSYVEKVYYIELDPDQFRNEGVTKGHIGKPGKLKTTENPILTSKEVLKILKIDEIMRSG